ncbi:hypothetical protein AALP_AAs61077U000100 [Arabis alpina]|uniref:Uncharacterized protein n=1 Tax=Arabis alpina TaxID=50452 RepID=A0A087FXG0_ARAAL|nr:hypothetical protein AALP_AAs61077U000100 [Arabis alpina]
MHIWWANVIQAPDLATSVQAAGIIFPLRIGFMLAHAETAGPSLLLLTKLMSARATFVQGTPLLQMSFTAILLADVPLMFLKVTSDNFTFDGI